MRIFVVNLHKHRRAFSALKIFSFFLAVLLLFIVVAKAHASTEDYVASAAGENEKKIVIIDAGHGGEDPGAIGASGVYEKNLNMEISIEVGNSLSEQGYAVVYTRTEDKLLYSESENIRGLRKISDLKNRCKIAAEYPEAIFVSIHMNSYGASKYSGLQVYYTEGNNESRTLANKIQSTVKKDLQPENNRQIKSGNSIYILENAGGTAVLIECGFLSNEKECQKLSQKEYQKELCFSISCGIIEYINEISGNI